MWKDIVIRYLLILFNKITGENDATLCWAVWKSNASGHLLPSLDSAPTSKTTGTTWKFFFVFMVVHLSTIIMPDTFSNNTEYNITVIIEPTNHIEAQTDIKSNVVAPLPSLHRLKPLKRILLGCVFWRNCESLHCSSVSKYITVFTSDSWVRIEKTASNDHDTNGTRTVPTRHNHVQC